MLGVESEHWDALIEKWRGQGRADPTINRRREVLSGAYNLALRRRLIGFAPYLRRLPENNVRRVTFSHEKWKLLLPEIEKRGADAFDYYCWIRRSPMRPSTVVGLRWEALDTEDPERWRYWVDGRIDKSNYDRTLPIEGELRRIIELRMKHRMPGCPWIFHRDGKKLNPDSLRENVFYPACRAVGLPTGRDGFIPYDAKRNAMKTHRLGGGTVEGGMRASGHKTKASWKRYDYVDLDVSSQEVVHGGVELGCVC